MAECEYIEACRMAYGGEGCKPACDLGLPCYLYEPKVDRGALMALADELDENAELIIRVARHTWLTGVPTMEEAEHDACEWRWIARRIREALGVDA